MQTGGTSAVGQQGQQTPGRDAFKSVDLNDFIKLLVTELQSQDPLEPMDNSKILQQVSQIREIESNQRLTDTMESVVLGQSVATAGNLIGRKATALSDAGQTFSGVVDRVSIAEGQVRVHIGAQSAALNNVSEIVAAPAS